jgi:hypothetical protein
MAWPGLAWPVSSLEALGFVACKADRHTDGRTGGEDGRTDHLPAVDRVTRAVHSVCLSGWRPADDEAPGGQAAQVVQHTRLSKGPHEVLPHLRWPSGQYTLNLEP